METADIESVHGIHGSSYDILLSDIIEGYEYSPNLAITEFSWATDAQLRLTPNQLGLLEMYFGEQPKPSPTTKREISEIASIPLEKVTVRSPPYHVTMLLTIVVVLVPEPESQRKAAGTGSKRKRFI